MNNKTFKINNHTWKIQIKSREEMLSLYKLINEDVIDCFGLTIKQYNTIYINENLCEEEQIKTLKHELVHCFIWEMGFAYVNFNDEEIICEFVATINDFINYVINRIKR